MEYNDFLENKNLYDENIILSIKYLIQLYYKTGCKYKCTLNKIEQLLIIYKLCCMKHNQDSFKEDYMIYNNKIHFRVLYDIFPTEPCEGYYVKEDGKKIEEVYYSVLAIPTPFLLEVEISQHSERLLRSIFINFINYSFEDLHKMIMEISDKLINQGVISNQEVYNFFTNDANKKLYKDNAIFKFIRKYKLIVKKENYAQEFDIDSVVNYFSFIFQDLPFEEQKQLLDQIINFHQSKKCIEAAPQKKILNNQTTSNQ